MRQLFHYTTNLLRVGFIRRENYGTCNNVTKGTREWWAKNHKTVPIFLHQDLVTVLRAVRPRNVAESDKLFAEGCPSMVQFRTDLEAAGIPLQDAHGRRLVFHSLRHSLATNLANSGAPRRVAMEVMRHSDSRLTDKTYTDAALLHTSGAIEALPSLLENHTQKHTTKLVTGCPGVSPVVPFSMVGNIAQTLANKGESHAPSNIVPMCPSDEVGCLARTRT